MTPDHFIDSIDAMLEDLPSNYALLILTGVVLNALGRCEDPHRATLGFIAAMTDLVRSAERDASHTEVPSLREWINSCWQPDEDEDDS